MHRKILISILALTSTFTVGAAQQADALLSEFEPQAYNGKEVFEAEAWSDEEIVYNHLDAETNEGDHPNLEGGIHLGVDRFCTSSNTVDNVCTIKDKTLRFSSDLYYKTDKTLVFDNTKIKCLTISYAPCSFMLSLQGGTETYLELKNGSTVTGK